MRSSAKRSRRVVFRLAAAAVGLAPFVLLELFLVVVDWGRPSDYGDPFAGFSSVRPLFVLNDPGTRYEIAKARQKFFCPDSFAAEKGAEEYRIFCLGGSTVQGRPFAIETSFSTWLELSLRVAEPRRRWEVVNCGGISYASYRLLPILEEVLRYSPDMIIVYTGHNEFLEDRTYGHIKYLPGILARPYELLSRLRMFTLLRAGYLSLTGDSGEEPPEERPTLASEVDALLDHKGGLEQYHRDEKWRRDVIEHFRYSLRRMVQLAGEAGVPLLLINPVSNLRDCPPFKSEHRDGLSPEELERWNALRATAARYYRRNKLQVVALLEKAIEIDDRHAGIHYELGECYQLQGMTAKARQAFRRAKELDICPLRILEPMNETVLEIARETGTPVVDVQEMFEKRSADGISGGDWLVDHVHPSILGHQLIAGALADEMARLGMVDPQPGWEDKRRRRFREHHDSLGDLYFAQGMERLKSVGRWARGRADPEVPGVEAPTESDSTRP